MNATTSQITFKIKECIKVNPYSKVRTRVKGIKINKNASKI